MERFAPNTAALETPSVEGEAIGLFRSVCMMRPDTERPAPAMIAAKTRGIRMFNTRNPDVPDDAHLRRAAFLYESGKAFRHGHMRRTDKQAYKGKYEHCRGEQDKCRPVPSSVFDQIRLYPHRNMISPQDRLHKPPGGIFFEENAGIYGTVSPLTRLPANVYDSGYSKLTYRLSSVPR